MNLADMLSYADIHQLSRIARHYACDCSTNSKHELIQSILSAINRSDIFEENLQALNLEELRFLNTLLFDKREAFSLEELMAWARKTRFGEGQPSGLQTPMVLEPFVLQEEKPEPPPKRKSRKAKKEAKTTEPEVKEWSPRETIMKFKHRGWLFNGHSHQTKYLFTVPRDLKRRIGDGMARQFQETIETSDTPSVYREEHDFLYGDILAFLRFVQQQDIMLTAEGFMYKRQLQQLLQTLQVEEPPVQRGAWRFGYGRKFKEYPNRLSLIYDYCYFQGYIDEAGDQLRLTEEGIAILSEGRKESPVEVYRFWIRLYKGAVSNIQPLVHWVNRLAERWVTVESLGRTLQPFIKPYYYDQPDSILEQRILAMMIHLGMLRMGQHEASGTVIQMTPLGRSLVSGTYIEEQDVIDLPVDNPAVN